MSHYAFRERGSNLELDADWVVVGSGAGGATAALSLARAGGSVVLVEAGAWRDPEHYPYTAYAGMRDLMPEFGASVTAGVVQWPIVQGAGVGGSTVVNSAIAVRTPPDVFELWQRDHGVCDPSMAARMAEIQVELERELGAETVADAALGHNNRLAIRGANALGYDNVRTTRFVKDCVGTAQCLQGCRSRRKQSLNLQFVPEVLTRGGTVLSCAPVHRVTFDGLRAVGVTGHFVHPTDKRTGAAFRVRARRGVWLAASVTQTPPLLLRSGVRHPQLGYQFRAHPGTAILGWYDDPVDMNFGATQGWASTAYRASQGFKLETLAIPSELVAGRLKGGGTQLMDRLAEYRHLALWVMAVRAESTGTISRGPFGSLVHYVMNPTDMGTLRAAMVTLARTHFAAGARWVLPGVHGLPFKVGPDQLHLLEEAPLDPKKWLCILSHLFGGAVMHQDPARGVVDGFGRVRGKQGLYVVDASAFPTTLGVNPQHTIMALARLQVERAVN